ncbi:DUF4222 domain-containing protein [Escherichia coli]|nr:DUF4222 domain-containing protein [Escherichia coli]
MKNKFSGFTASGLSRPEILPGDIFKDNYGGRVTIKGVAERRITYRREGYGYDCAMPAYQFRRDFSLVQATPRKQPTSKEKAQANIQAIRKMLNGIRGKK